MEWLLTLRGDTDPAVRALLMRTLVDNNLLLFISLFWTQVCWLAAYLATGWTYIVVFSAADLFVFFMKWRIRQTLNKSNDTAQADIYLIICILSWNTLIAIEVLTLFAAPSLRTCVLAVILSIGYTGYSASLYAGFPRLAISCIASLNIPLIIGLAMSFETDLHILALLVPCGGVAYIILMYRAHGSLLEAVQAQHHHYQQSRQDTLTGLSNRLVMMEQLSSYCASPATPSRNSTCLAVLCLDLDGFKAVNDRFGHAAGDKVLLGVSRRLRAVVRGMDTVSRVGGDEFVVLMPAADQSAVHAIARRIVDAIAEPLEIGEADEVKIGVSIGIAFLAQDAMTPEALLALADAALYDAKSAGKGRFESARTSQEHACSDARVAAAI